MSTRDWAVGMTLSTLERDDQLVEAARSGDDRAFEELYSRYRAQIRRFAFRLTHDLDRADDITQEVFISALRRLRDTDREIAFRPWIYEIARNACIDEHRRTRRVQEVPIERDGEIGWFPALATTPSPEVAIESKQRLDDLCGAFRGLSERHHRVIVLRELEGKSYSQIGDELGMSKMVVESTLFRARRRLTEEFEDLTSGKRCEYVQRLLAHGGTPKTLGLRDRRSLTGHIEHCRSCRREAYVAGWQDVARESRTTRKVAALIPVPFLRLHARIVALFRGAHHSTLPAATTAMQYVTPATSLAAGGRAAVTAVGLIAAVVGGGIAGGAAERAVGLDDPADAASLAAQVATLTPAPGANPLLITRSGRAAFVSAPLLTTAGEPSSPFASVASDGAAAGSAPVEGAAGGTGAPAGHADAPAGTPAGGGSGSGGTTGGGSTSAGGDSGPSTGPIAASPDASAADVAGGTAAGAGTTAGSTGSTATSTSSTATGTSETAASTGNTATGTSSSAASGLGSTAGAVPDPTSTATGTASQAGGTAGSTSSSVTSGAPSPGTVSPGSVGSPAAPSGSPSGAPSGVTPPPPPSGGSGTPSTAGAPATTTVTSTVSSTTGALPTA